MITGWLTFLVVGAACLGGALTVAAVGGRALRLLTAERQSALYRLSYALMAISVVAFALRGLAAGR